MRVAYAALLALAASGCGLTVADVCEKLERCPDPVGSDCQQDGELLEERSSHACDTEFDIYLECVDARSCEWRSECAHERDAIDDCVGGLPQ